MLEMHNVLTFRHYYCSQWS